MNILKYFSWSVLHLQILLTLYALDLGRSAAFLAKVSTASDVNIINVAGWWLDVPRFLHGVSANQMAREFIKDIEMGFRGTEIKAGLLKCAADSEGVTAQLEVMNRAVARAHFESGTPTNSITSEL